MRRSYHLLACAALTIQGGILAEANAAPALRPKTAYEQCLQQRSRCEYSTKNAFASCLSDSGTVSPAQYYCLQRVFSQMILTYKSDLDFKAIQADVAACVQEHHQDLEPDAQLDLSDERYKMCSAIANFEYESCLNENDCSKLAPKDTTAIPSTENPDGEDIVVPGGVGVPQQMPRQ